MSAKKKVVLFFFLIFVGISGACRSLEENREKEKKLVKDQTEEVVNRFEKFLVPVERYSTVMGARLHKKHHSLLIGLAREYTDIMKLKVEDKSVGFYFDKRSKGARNLFLGMDISLDANYDESYIDSSVDIVRNQLKKMLETVSVSVSVFKESQVAGVVIGWRWYQSGGRERLTLWIPKGDMYAFLHGRLTFEEMVQRSTITNSQNNIIRLPL